MNNDCINCLVGQILFHIIFIFKLYVNWNRCFLFAFDMNFLSFVHIC